MTMRFSISFPLSPVLFIEHVIFPYQTLCSWVCSSFLFFALLASSTLIFASCSIIVYQLLYLLLPCFTVTVTWPAAIFVSLASREKNKKEAAEGMTVWTWVLTWELAITGSSTALNVNRITSQSKTSTKFAWLLSQASYSHTQHISMTS